MPEVNKANRQVCDVHFYNYTDKTPFLDFDTANTTTAGLSGESVYAMAKGAKRISFPNPLEGTFSITAQVYPFKFFSLFSDGTVDNGADLRKTIDVTSDGQKAISFEGVASNISGVSISEDGENWFSATVADKVGDKGKVTLTVKPVDGVAPLTLKASTKYKVSYFNKTSGVKKITFNNKKLPKDYYVVMSTVDKDENGDLTPFHMIIYKATVQRNFELSFTSEGDPAEVTATFDILEDKDGNVLDFVEITE